MKVSAKDIFKAINAADIKLRYGIFAGILLVVAALDYFLAVQFQMKSLASLRADVKTVAADIERVKGDMGRIDKTKEGLKAPVSNPRPSCPRSVRCRRYRPFLDRKSVV